MTESTPRCTHYHPHRQNGARMACHKTACCRGRVGRWCALFIVPYATLLIQLTIDVIKLALAVLALIRETTSSPLKQYSFAWCLNGSITREVLAARLGMHHSAHTLHNTIYFSSCLVLQQLPFCFASELAVFICPRKIDFEAGDGCIERADLAATSDYLFFPISAAKLLTSYRRLCLLNTKSLRTSCSDDMRSISVVEKYPALG